MLVNERPENRRNPEFDNEASLREARKKLPFELFLEQHGSAESCLFCQTQGSVKVITRPVVTGKISRATIEAVNAIEIVRVVEPRVPLKKNKACCPFHPEKSPGFNVVPRKNRFHCFGCPKSGGPINFIREFCHLDFLPSVERLAKEFGVPIVHATRGQETVFKGTNPGGTSGTWQEGDEWDEMDVLVGESQLAVWEGRKALTRTEAFMVFLKEAGVWKDRGRFKPNRGNIEHPTSNAEHPMNAAPSPPVEDGQPEQVVAPGTPGNVKKNFSGRLRIKVRPEPQ